MNDDELMTLVREQRGKVPMTTPVQEIIRRGRAVRARRRVPGLAAAVAVMAGTAVAVTALAAPGHQAPGRPGAQLAAWTVTRQADGEVSVTIRELRDPAGLQATLRADGVPAAVAAGSSGPPPGCRLYPANPSLLEKIVQMHPGQEESVLVIDPPAIPRGAGLGITVFPLRVRGIGHPAGTRASSGAGAGSSLVYAGPQCTGS
jgi:hypothetical protein